MQELHDTHGVVFDLTSIYRDRDNKFHSDHSPHSSASAIDLHTFNNPSFLNFMFGNQYDQNTFSNTTSMKNWKMTPEAEAFFRKHNLRLFDERPAPGGSHFHIDISSEDGNDYHEMKNNITKINDNYDGFMPGTGGHISLYGLKKRL